MKICAASLVLLCLLTGARAQNVARQSLVLETDGKLTWAAFSPGGELLATSYGDKTTVRLWDTRTGELRAKLSGKDDPANYEDSSIYFGRVTVGPASATFSPDGQLLAVVARVANEVRLWNAPSGKLLAVLRGLTDVRRVRFSPDGRTLAIAAGDQGLRLLDLRTGSLLTDRWRLKAIKSIDSVWFPPGSKNIALLTTSYDSPKHSLYLIDLETGEVRARAGDKRGKNYYIAYASEDGAEMATLGEGGEVTLWDVATGQARWGLKLGRKGYPLVDFGPDARSLAVLNEDGTVGVWDCEKGQLRATLPEKEKVSFVAYHTGPQSFLITATRQGLRLWDPKTLEPSGEMAGARLPLAFSRDGKMAITAGPGNNAILWHLSAR